MKRKIVVSLIILAVSLILTACNKSPINLFDYTHKPAVEFVHPDENGERIDFILNN